MEALIVAIETVSLAVLGIKRLNNVDYWSMMFSKVSISDIISSPFLFDMYFRRVKLLIIGRPKEKTRPNPSVDIPDSLDKGTKLDGFLIYIPAFILAIMPALLGFFFIKFDIIYAGSLRPVVFELSWLLFAFLIVAISIISKAPVIEEAKKLSKPYLGVFVLFACVWLYTSVVVAPSSRMANYASGIGVAAVLVGLASAALRRRYGDRVVLRISWSLFVAMLLHAPFLIWLYFLEGISSDFDWTYGLPGYPGLRMYNYSIEAGIAAGLGLYFLSGHTEKLKKLFLIIGVSLLWMLLFWSGARGGLFALLTTILFAACIVPKFAKKMWGFVLLSMSVGACLSLFLPVPNGGFGLINGIFKSVNFNSLDDLSSGRIAIWSDAFGIFLERPIFGHGIAQYRHLTDKIELTVHEHVHNILLEALVSFGLIGTVALIYLLGKIWRGAAYSLSGSNSLSTLPIFLVATTLLAHGFLSGTYYHIHSVFILAISFGFLLKNGKEKVELNFDYQAEQS